MNPAKEKNYPWAATCFNYATGIFTRWSISAKMAESWQEAVHIVGEIVLFLIPLRMIPITEKSILGDLPEGEPFVAPLAVPLLAGPSTLAILILLVRSQPDRIIDWLIAVIGGWPVTSLIMLSSYKLYKLLGKRGLIAAEWLMELVLVVISVQMLLDGITTYLGIIPVS